MLSRFSIKGSIFNQIFGVTALMLVFMFAIVVFAYRQSAALVDLDEARTLQSDLGHAAMHMQAFLRTGDTEHEARFDATVQHAAEAARAVAGHDGQTGLPAAIEGYASAFAELRATLAARGLADTLGAAGRVAAHADAVEAVADALGDTRLQIAVLEARRAEKAYVISRDDDDRALLTEALSAVEARAARLRMRRDTRDALATGLDGYRAEFATLIDLLDRIDTQVATLDAHRVAAEDLAATEMAAAEDVASTAQLVLWIVGLLALVVCGSLAWRVARSTARPIRRLDRAVRAIAEGDLDVHIDVERADELGGLADSTRRMIETVRALVEETRRLTTAGAVGRLQERGHIEHFEGAYQAVIMGFNETLDAFAEPLQDAQRVISALAAGDLTARMETHYQGDLKQLADSLNDAVQRIDETLVAARTAAVEVEGGSAQVASASQDLARSATEQASGVQETAAAMIEIGEQVRATAERVQSATELAANFSMASEHGRTEMSRLAEAMAEIDRSSQDISRIIKVIDEIAFQTNLLALNAAVEAARAGRHGKGFAVVAAEVRELAARSAKAARETADLIEGAVQKARTGSTLAERTREVLAEIAQGSGEMNELMQQVARAADEQSAGVAQVQTALVQIDANTQRNASIVEESASAAEQLSGQARNVQRLMGRFQLSIAQTAQAAPGYHTPAEETTSAWGAEAQYAQGDGGYYDPDATPELTDPSSIINLDDDDFGRY